MINPKQERHHMKSIIHKGLILLPLALSSFVATPSWGQEVDQPWLIRARALQLNWANQQNNGLNTTNVTEKNKTIPEVDISYFLQKNIALELSLTYPQSIDINVGGSSAGQLKGLPPSLVIQYYFTDLGLVKPYVGLGVNYTSFTGVNILNGSAAVNSNSTGAVAQVGFDYMVDKNWGVNVDVKYIQMKTDVYVGSHNIGQLGLNPTTFAIGATYRF
jgi:outer membrane protein